MNNKIINSIDDSDLIATFTDTNSNLSKSYFAEPNFITREEFEEKMKIFETKLNKLNKLLNIADDLESIKKEFED